MNIVPFLTFAIVAIVCGAAMAAMVLWLP